MLLINRLIWLAVGAGALALTFLRFRMAEPLERDRASRGRRPSRRRAPPHRRAAGRRPARPRRWLLPRLIWLAFRETVKNIHFLVIALAGVLFVVVAARMSELMFGTATYPVTRAMIELGGGGFACSADHPDRLAGELVWREREARIDQIVDALPVPVWLLYPTKLAR